MHVPSRLIATLLLTPSLALWAEPSAGQWPQWRGPEMTAVVEDNRQLPEHWSTTENIAWKTEVPGLGWSSPVVWGDLVFVTAVVTDDDAFEAPRAGLYLPDTGVERPPDRPSGVHRWMVYAFDVETGALRWEQVAHEGPAVAPRHPKNSFASATPVTDGRQLYVLFGNLGLFAYDFDGTPLWSQRLPTRSDKWGWGTGSSPTLLDDQVIVLHDNEEESYVAAFDTSTGAERWRTLRDEVSAWSTPVVWRNTVRTEIVTVGKEKVRSYDADGKLLWYLSGNMTKVTIPTPIPSPEMIYVSSGYVADNHRPVYAIRPGASGDITLAPGERSNEFVAWYRPRVGSYNPSPLLYRDYYYTLHDGGFLTAHDAATGEPAYGRQRLKTGATFTASLWAYNDKIFALSEDGTTYVIEAGPNYRLVGENALDEMTLASPAIAGDTVLIRTLSHLYAIRRDAR